MQKQLAGKPPPFLPGLQAGRKGGILMSKHTLIAGPFWKSWNP
ncbi:hypothetical protein [Salmonella enterica]|nr:hypothetical protein [Salmonella enterica]